MIHHARGVVLCGGACKSWRLQEVGLLLLLLQMCCCKCEGVETYRGCCWSACGHCIVLQVSFVASVNVLLADGSCVVMMVDQLSRIVQTPATAVGKLAHFNPFDGSSSWAQPTATAPRVEHRAGNECLQQQEW